VSESNVGDGEKPLVINGTKDGGRNDDQVLSTTSESGDATEDEDDAVQTNVTVHETPLTLLKYPNLVGRTAIIFFNWRV
jgi:hypothetical protein